MTTLLLLLLLLLLCYCLRYLASKDTVVFGIQILALLDCLERY